VGPRRAGGPGQYAGRRTAGVPGRAVYLGTDIEAERALVGPLLWRGVSFSPAQESDTLKNGIDEHNRASNHALMFQTY
jgi:hypothetical protein